MKRYIVFGLVLAAMAGTFFPVDNAEARRKVVCTFEWENNAAMNVKGSHNRYKTKEVRNKEHQRIVQRNRNHQ